MLSHRNICMLAANSQYLAALGMTLTAEQMGVPVDALRSRMPRLVSLLIFPLFHISGLTSLIMTMLSGGQVVTIRRWDPPAAMAEIEAKRINFLTGPALVLSDLLDLPGAAERLRYVINIGVGGQATPASLARRIKEAVPNAQDGNGWGMTELSGSVSAAKGALFDAKPDSCGFLSPLMEVRTVDDHGNVLHPGEIGELQLRGPLVMLGYWGKEAETAAILKDGWLSTGDIGRIDEDGFLYLADRKKDIVISAGENIFCAEVERVITSDQRVAEVAMFGVPDARLGERAIAVINLRPGQTCSSDEMAGLIAGRLADYKVPSEFVFDLGPIPRNAIGKIDKARLRDAYFAQARS